jgi:hypothetical protein
MDDPKHIYHQFTDIQAAKRWDAYLEWRKLPASTRMRAGARVGWDWGKSGNLAFGLPIMAFELGHAPRGEFVSTAAGGAVGLASYPMLSTVLTIGLAAIPGVGLGMAAIAGGALASIPSQKLEDWTARGVRRLTATGLALRRLDFGRNYQDSPTAQMSRMRSITEMSGALGTSRRFLGSEAAYLHQ